MDSSKIIVNGSGEPVKLTLNKPGSTLIIVKKSKTSVLTSPSNTEVSFVK